MKVLIIEDEELAARNLQSVLRNIGNIQVINVLDSVESSIEWFSENPQPELVFMDIHLADGSSFLIFDQVTIHCPIIFTTAYDEYAIKAFHLNSIDYLLKPVTREGIERALEKLKRLKESSGAELDINKLISAFNKNKTYKTHFLIPVKGSKLIPLQVKDVAYFHIEDGLVKAKTVDDKSYVMEETLDELANMLNPVDFFRANRQFIIARSSIKEVDLWFNSRLSVNLKIKVAEKILISKIRVPEFKGWFSGTDQL